MQEVVTERRATERTTFRYWTDREELLGPLFLAPAVIYIVALVGIPFFLAIAFSMSDVTAGDKTLDFVGLDNYRAILQSSTFWAALQQTFIFTIISQVLVVVLAKILALLLSKDFPGRWIARFFILLPWATPVSLGTIGGLWLLDSKFSPIDWILRYYHLLGEAGALLGPENNMFYLGRTNLAMASVILVHVWRILPLATVIILAGLTAIPQDIKDQAAVDGAGFWRELFQITIPLMLPIITIALLFGTIFTFTDMTVVYVLTRGEPKKEQSFSIQRSPDARPPAAAVLGHKLSDVHLEFADHRYSGCPYYPRYFDSGGV